MRCLVGSSRFLSTLTISIDIHGLQKFLIRWELNFVCLPQQLGEAYPRQWSTNYVNILRSSSNQHRIFMFYFVSLKMYFLKYIFHSSRSTLFTVLIFFLGICDGWTGWGDAAWERPKMNCRILPWLTRIERLLEWRYRIRNTSEAPWVFRPISNSYIAL